MNKLNAIEEVLEYFDDKVEEWHNGDSLHELHTYLGMNFEEYNYYVCFPELFAGDYLNKKKKTNTKENIMNYTVKVKKLHEDAKLPRIAKLGDAGADLFAIEDTTIQPQQTLVVKTGIAIELPAGTEALIRPTSGNALKTGTILPNSPGTIDEGYRGEVGVIMRNLNDTPLTILKGKKIAQMCVREVPTIKFVEVDELCDSERGDSGYGSTGVMNK